MRFRTGTNRAVGNESRETSLAVHSVRLRVQGQGGAAGTLSMAVSSSPRPTASLMMAPDSFINSVTLVSHSRVRAERAEAQVGQRLVSS